MTMSAVVLLVVLFSTGLLTDMPKAVLAGIVFLIGLDLDRPIGPPADPRAPSERVRHRGHHRFRGVRGRGRAGHHPRDRALDPRDHPAAVQAQGLRRRRRRRRASRRYQAATPGTQSAPGLIVFRYDADLFYANSSRFVDDVEGLVEHAPDPVRWLVLDAGALDDIDYSRRDQPQRPAGLPGRPEDHLRAGSGGHGLLETLQMYGLRSASRTAICSAASKRPRAPSRRHAPATP